MVGAVIILLVVLAALAVVGWLSLAATVEKAEETDHLVHDPATPTLAYAVPPGVDPALLRGSLDRAGFTCTVEETPGSEIVRIVCDDGRREEARGVLEHAPLDVDRSGELKDTFGAVRFMDETRAA